MSLDEYIIDPLENIFDQLGAMQGDLAPLKRAAIGGAVGYAVAKVFMPSIAYTDDGKEKPFKLTSDDPNATWFPPLMFAAVPAFVASVLI